MTTETKVYDIEYLLDRAYGSFTIQPAVSPKILERFFGVK